VLQGDTNLVMCTLVLSCIMLVLGNLIADSLLQVLDPRVRA
jgi:ABC-type dipeptide/oligopeptide/nickel transport system permease component